MWKASCEVIKKSNMVYFKLGNGIKKKRCYDHLVTSVEQRIKSESRQESNSKSV